MTEKKRIIVVFNSKTHAFRLESLLDDEGYHSILYNAPGYLAKSCSMAIRIDERAYQFVLEKIRKSKLDVFKIYKLCYENNEKIYRVLKKY
ncbi:MAG: DUF3343 domain-containing protein [Maledivibacter sp.]|jgi:hypothetical protein|nr:DUF3343 domain-containing protein [Maledivibacter sp.]